MKTFYITLSVMAICLFSSFKTSNACEYTGSNMGYVKTQTQRAIDAADLNSARFLTYKALQAIYKSQKQLNDCGCERAAISIEESRHHLKLAAKATSINGAKVLLAEALHKTMSGLEALEKHHLHEKPDTTKDLAMNMTGTEEGTFKTAREAPDNETLHRIIDKSLLAYQSSLNKVVDSVNCTDARAYAERVFKNCEQELLKPDLSEGKKYYNLRTQEITAKALKQLGNCETASSK